MADQTEALRLVIELREDLAWIHETMALELKFEQNDALVVLRNRLQSAQGTVDNLGTLLADEVDDA